MEGLGIRSIRLLSHSMDKAQFLANNFEVTLVDPFDTNVQRPVEHASTIETNTGLDLSFSNNASMGQTHAKIEVVLRTFSW